MADSTLAFIQKKVRRLTRSPSTALLSDADLNEYINTFVLYDFPEHLRLFALRTTLTWFCEPNIDTYEQGDGFLPADFKDKYITVHPPIYIAGYEVLYTQSREQFFGIYPMTNTIALQDTGDGATTDFQGTLSAIPVLANNVTFVSIDGSGAGLVLYDDGDENLIGDGTGTIDYVTGFYTLSFNTAPGDAQQINSETVVYQPQRPLAVLYYDYKFTLRPVPDQPYRVNLEVFIRPTELLSTSQSPELEQWSQYIAYGAAKKIFEDRMDTESVAQIMPEFKQQERLVLRTTLVQQSNERTATIYSDNTSGGLGGGWWGSSSGT